MSRLTARAALSSTPTHGTEIDDQFAIIHALMSPEMRIETIQAAGFHAAVRNTKSFEHGMELSYDEIRRVLELSPGGLRRACAVWLAADDDGE